MDFRNNSNSLKIFTWHIHGTYLYYLSLGDYTLYIPVTEKKSNGYYGRGETFPFGDNVIEVPVDEVKNMDFDCILFQHKQNYALDQFDILSDDQRKLPRIYLEHDPPIHHPSDTVHVVDDPNVIMVHVTHFNQLMWRCCSKVNKVIEHGVPDRGVDYDGSLEKGIVVINHLFQRGRLLGSDIFAEVSKEVPLDFAGMGTLEYGGLGEILYADLPYYSTQYRFFFNPIRYTSLGLAFCEAMMAGIPVVALATTEYTTVIKDGINGFIQTDRAYLVEKMKALLSNKRLATKIGQEGKKTAMERFSIERFIREWKEIFQLAINNKNLYEKENSIYK